LILPSKSKAYPRYDHNNSNLLNRQSFLEDFENFVEGEIFADVHRLGKSKIGVGNHSFEDIKMQCLQLREENSRCYKKIEDLQVLLNYG
jgi:hypothetical protein